MQMLDEAPSFASVADKIGNRALEKVLRQLASEVGKEIRFAKSTPLRAQVRSDLKRLKAETKRFESALNRVPLLELPSSEIDCLPQARQTIHDIKALCDATLSIHSAKGGVRKKPGRVTCAMIVIEAWAYVRGDLPGSNNREVQEICDDYWGACGYETIGQGDPGNWRRTVTDALSKQGAMRRYIRHVISEEIQRCTE
jgi:hypothetical protein